ncbi:MAG: hypothetical protein H8D75_00165 [Rhodospirillaceae bacterium]|nr:hypothetical protein [Rhodospirillaceae bacterium]MBL6932259.1 hypothetical protein [Rhodospirillales bacterium]
MITIDQIKELTENPDILTFMEFLINSSEGKAFPDYKKLDLMEIPALVPNVWVIDFREIENRGCLFHFSGTEVDRNYNRNITGIPLEELYSGNDFERLVEHCYQNVYYKKRPAYSKRSVHFHDGFIDKFRRIEAILVPCSEDGENVDFAIGLAFYNISDESTENVYVLI